MNKFSAFLLLVTLVMATSCKKTYQCECKTFDGVVTDVAEINDLGRFGAKNVCESYQNQNNLNGQSYACSLK